MLGKRRSPVLVGAVLGLSLVLSGCGDVPFRHSPEVPGASPTGGSRGSGGQSPSSSPRTISAKTAEGIALDKFGGTSNGVQSGTWKKQPVWVVSLTSKAEGRIVIKIDKSNAKIVHWGKLED